MKWCWREKEIIVLLTLVSRDGHKESAVLSAVLFQETEFWVSAALILYFII